MKITSCNPSYSYILDLVLLAKNNTKLQKIRDYAATESAPAKGFANLTSKFCRFDDFANLTSSNCIFDESKQHKKNPPKLLSDVSADIVFLMLKLSYRITPPFIHAVTLWPVRSTKARAKVL